MAHLRLPGYVGERESARERVWKSDPQHWLRRDGLARGRTGGQQAQTRNAGEMLETRIAAMMRTERALLVARERRRAWESLRRLEPRRHLRERTEASQGER